MDHPAPKDMARPTLTTLPRELRDRIFEFVLSSPTGKIRLQDSFIRPLPYFMAYEGYNSRATINLSFLRTCRLINDECKHRLWDYNTLDLATQSRAYSGLYFFKGYLQSLKTQDSAVKLHVRHVSLDVEFFHEKYQPDVEMEGVRAFDTILRELANWSREGRLESICLRICHQYVWHKGWGQTFFAHDHLKELLNRRRMEEIAKPETRPYQAYLDVMKKTTQEGGSLSHIDRTIVIKTGSPEFFPRGGFPSRSFVAENGDPMDLLGDLNSAWGGSLLVDGVLSYQTGALVGPVFEAGRKRKLLNGVYGEDLYYATDVRVYRQATHYANIYNLSLKDVHDKMAESRKFSAEVETLWRDWIESEEFDQSQDNWLSWLSAIDEELPVLPDPSN
jgi:hypothetical protein